MRSGMTEQSMTSKRHRFFARYRFLAALGCVCIVGLAIRLHYLITVMAKIPIGGDAQFYYYWGAVQLSRGNGFIGIATVTYNVPIPAAHQPPGFVVFLAAFYKLGLHSPNDLRFAMCFVGTLTILVMGLLVAKIESQRAGLICALITATYPSFWINDTVLMSETLLLLALAVGLYGVYSYVKRPSIRWILLASTGLLVAAMVRAEILFLLPVTLLPLIFRRGSFQLRTRFLHVGLASIIPLLTVGSWTAYNASRFSRPVLMSTGFGPTALAGACHTVFYGPQIGSIFIPCASPSYVHDAALSAHEKSQAAQRFAQSNRYFQKHGDLPPATWDTHMRPTTKYVDESVDSALATKLWMQYSRGHKDQLPHVVLAREARITGLWNAKQQVVIDSYNGRGTYWLTRLTQRMFWLMCAFGLIGAIRWRRLRIPLYPLVVDICLTLVITGIVFALTRYRVAADLMIVPLAATGIDVVLSMIGRKVRWRTSNTPH